MFDTKCNNSSSFASTRNTELFNLSKVSMLPGQLVRPVSKVSSIFSNAIESKSKNFCERDTPNTSEGSQSSEHNKEDGYALCKTPEQKTINFDLNELCKAPRLLSEYTKEELLKISTPKQRKMEFDPKEDCKAPLFKGLKFKTTEEQCNINNRIEVAVEAVENISLYKTTIHTK